MSRTRHGEEEVLGKAYDARLMLRVWQFVRPHWFTLAVAMALVPITIGFELAQPYLLSEAITHNIGERTMDGLATLAMLFASCVILQALSSYAQLYALQLVGQRSMHDLRRAAYRHVVTRRAAFFDRVPVGRLMTRLTNDVESINEMFASGVVTLVVDFVKLAGIVGVMLWLNVKLTLITFVTLPVLVAVVAWARNIMRASFREIRVKLAAMNAYLAEHLNGLRVVQLFCREQKAVADYDELGAGYRDAYLGAIRADSGMYAIVEAIGITSGAAIAWYAGGSIGKTGLTVGLVVAFVEYVNKFFIPVRDFSAKYTVMQSAMAATERIVALLDTEENDAPVDAARDSRESASAPAIELRGVDFSYRPGEPVLSGLDLTVPRASTVAVVGATGSGKSTIIRLLARLYEPNAGDICIFGRDVKSWPASELRARMAVVSQDVFLFAGTIEDNVRLGKLDASRDEISRALARVGADEVLARRGATLDTAIAERGSNFSAGERQLISFARALVRDPDILVLDEATAHVDPETEGALERGVRALMEGRTTLVIAHRLSTIRHADAIVVMSKGKIAEAGTRAELLSQDGMYAMLERTFQRA